MFATLLKAIFGSKNDRELKRILPLVETINSLEPRYKNLNDLELQSQTPQFKSRLDAGSPLDELLPEAFAVVREASKRVLGMRHFDVQLVGGIVLHEGKIAEMKTGEGKTLCATLPVYLNALTGKGVHLVTVNDYLAKRDAEWMGAIYSFLGLSTGIILGSMEPEEHRSAYQADITYGQNNEFGFDYLRDNMKLELTAMVQRGHNYAIVDEVDSILIDEARTPLIISGASEDPTEKYIVARDIVKTLKEEEHYQVDHKDKRVMLTDEGVKRVEELFAIENLYDPLNIESVHHINQALRARVIMKRDVDYVVRDNQVIIVDEFTGRLMPGRRWSDGLHQAVEAKEGVKIARESQTIATITFQNYFRMYKKLAGMTGTADTEALEFKKIYNLDVVLIPTNQPMIRDDCADVVFATEKGKFKAVCEEIEELVTRGQPVLVGTASIEKSEILSAELSKRSIRHHVLNAKQHEREAEIVAQAGRFGAVTISTNMAGRGTDIVLGGNPEFLAAAQAGNRDPQAPGYQEQLQHFKTVCGEERENVLSAGGLHILGTERHESRRIDNQLRGRSGRQGDPGSSRFYVSLEDDLMKRFGGERMQAIMARVGLKDDDAIEGRLVARAIENAQKKVEGYHFEIRKHLLEYDDVMTKQRGVVYGLRSQILKGEDVEEEILEIIPDVIMETVLQKVNVKEPVAQWDISGMFAEFQKNFAIALPTEDFVSRAQQADQSLAQDIYDLMKETALTKYEERKQRFGPERMLKLVRIVFLQAIDYFWKEHLANMDHLRDGINLRGYGQQNPLYVYQREAYELFQSMMLMSKVSVIQNVFIPELPSDDDLRELEERERELQRQRVAEATATHQSVLDISESKVSSNQQTLDTSSRRVRRLKEHGKRAGYQPTASDDAPSSGGSRSPSAKQMATRKKNKLARKARKKVR